MTSFYFNTEFLPGGRGGISPLMAPPLMSARNLRFRFRLLRAHSLRRTPLGSNPFFLSEKHISLRLIFFLAEEEGFEPSVPARGTLVFETSQFNHSCTLPRLSLIITLLGEAFNYIK